MMNERIKALAQQAGDSIPEFHFGDYNIPNEFIEKFAELIVRECVKVCADRGTHHDGLYSAWAVDCSKRIEKHFGVE